jgi:hypothetical protein
MARRGGVVLPFTLQASLLRALLRPLRPTRRGALSLAALLCGWAAARTARVRAAAAAAQAQCAPRLAALASRRASHRERVSISLGAAALLLLFTRDARDALAALLHADARARWRRRRALRRALAAAQTEECYARAAAELQALDAPPRAPRAPSREALAERRLMSEFKLGAAMLQELCEGNRLDETEPLDLWVALRAGLAAHAADVAAAALCADEDAGAAARKSAAVTRTVDQLLYEAPDVAGFGLRERAAMLEETLTICGRPALLLSGGGMLGAVHVGAQSEKRIAEPHRTCS